MANFCKYCGKVLQDGEICSCPQAQAEAAQQYQSQQQPQGGYQQPPQEGYQQPQGYQQPPQEGYQQPQGYQQPPQGSYQQPPQGYQYQPPQGYQQPPQPAGPNPIVIALQKILPYIQSYIKAPISAAQDLMAQKDMTFAAVLLCVQIIVGGLLPISLVSSYLNNIGDVYGGTSAVVVRPFMGDDITEDYLKTLDRSFSMFGDDIKFSSNVLMSLVFGILAAAAAIAVFVVVAFAVSKIAGSNCSIQDVVIAAAANSPLVTVLLLLSFICFFFFLPLGVFFLVAAVLCWMVLAIPTFQALAPNAAQGKFWISAFAGILAALMIGGWAAYTIGSMSVGSATCRYDGKTYTVDELREDYF